MDSEYVEVGGHAIGVDDVVPTAGHDWETSVMMWFPSPQSKRYSEVNRIAETVADYVKRVEFYDRSAVRGTAATDFVLVDDAVVVSA